MVKGGKASQETLGEGGEDLLQKTSQVFARISGDQILESVTPTPTTRQYVTQKGHTKGEGGSKTAQREVVREKQESRGRRERS